MALESGQGYSDLKIIVSASLKNIFVCDCCVHGYLLILEPDKKRVLLAGHAVQLLHQDLKSLKLGLLNPYLHDFDLTH